MGLSRKQQNDIDVIRWFIPTQLQSIEITEQNILDFLANSERGEFKGRKDAALLKVTKDCDGFDALCWGKVWRGRTIHEIVKPWHLDGFGWVGWYDFLGGFDDEPIPKAVVDFYKKEMKCCEKIIGNIYLDILKDYKQS